MEICRYAEAAKTPDRSCIYYCTLHGYRMGLEFGHWCEGCEEYATEFALNTDAKSSRSCLPCAVCRFRPTCRLRHQDRAGCPYFSQK